MHNSPAIRATMIAALTLLPLSLLITFGLLSAGATYTTELMATDADAVLSINVLLKALLAGAGALLLMYVLRPLAVFTLERKPVLGLSLTLSTALLIILWHYVAPFAGQAAEFIYHRLAAGMTAALIAVLVCIEVSIVLMSRLAARAPAETSAGGKQDYRLMRPAIFIFLFGIDLSMAFIPLYMGQMDHALFGLSRDIIMGLPISVEFFFVGVAILLAGVWFDKRGWQEPFYVGLALAAVGACYSWLAPDALHFILSRGLVGFGYGLVQLSSHGFVIRNTDKSTKAQGMAHLAAGLYAGSICGAATGAVIAERFGYEVVFLSGVLVIMSVAIYSLLMFGYREPVTDVSAESANEAEQAPAKPQNVSAPGTRSALSQFLLDRRVLAAIFFSSMPASIAVVGFLNYFSPVYLNGQGIADSTIGQVLMLFGICLALLGPRIGKLIDATEQKQYLVMAGSLIGALAFLSFSIWDGLTATVIAIVLLGLSNCLVLSAQSVYLLRLDVTQRLGEGKALGIFRSTSRIGQMLGPVVFAWLFVFQDVGFGVAWLGVAYIVMAVIFFWMVQSQSSRVSSLPEEAV